ncbi:MAG: serine/threonine-protein kinase [Pirellulales bacterium]
MAASTEFWSQATTFLDSKTDPMRGGTPVAPTLIDASQANSTFDLSHQSLDATRKYLRDWLDPSQNASYLGRLGSFDVIDILGEGGMGLVLRALDVDLHREVAIKTLRPHLVSSDIARSRFAREARTAAALKHPNIVPIYSVDSWKNVPYLVMPLFEHGTLESLAQRQRFSLDDILEVAMQIALGLREANQKGVVHRDIKPSNILIEEGLHQIVITDFGLARAYDEDLQSKSGLIAGTPQFMSPEQARGMVATHASDMFSLGGVLYWMATQRFPFHSDTLYGSLHRIIHDAPLPISRWRADLPSWLELLIEKLLAKDPALRFASADEFSKILQGCIDYRQGIIDQLPTVLLTTPSTTHTRHGISSIPIALAAVAIVSLVLGIFWIGKTGLPSFTQTMAHDSSNTHSEQTKTVVPHREIMSESAREANVVFDQSELENRAAATPNSKELLTEKSSAREHATTDRSTPDRSVPDRTTPDRTGPLDALDEVVLLDDLKNEKHLDYWLDRLQQRPTAEISQAVLNSVAKLAQNSNKVIADRAKALLARSPFEEFISENPFQAVDFPTDISSPPISVSKEP